MTVFSGHLLPIALGLGLVAATYLHREVMTAAQPLRLKLAEKGEALLSRTDVPASLRADVEIILDEAFPNNPLFIILGMLLAPIFTPYIIFNAPNSYKSVSEANKDVRGSYLEICNLHRRICIANHPVLLPILEFEVSVIFAFIMPFALAWRHWAKYSRYTEMIFDRDRLVMSLEKQQRHLKLAPARRMTTG